MFKSLLEPFISPTDEAKQEDLRYYYGDKRPNAIYSAGDRNIPLTSPTSTYMGTDATGMVKLWDNTVIPKMDRKQSALNDKHLLPNNALTNTLLTERQQACEALGPGEMDQFAHLSNLAANVNDRNRMRCGWIYNTANPNNGRGAYGLMTGALDSSVSGMWMWDLQAAKKKFHAALCNEVKSCDDLSDSKYKGRCGFCATSRKGVPISGSVVAYPYDPMLTCSARSLITSSDRCPAPPPPPPRDSPAYSNYVANRQVCDPLANGTIPRDCLITKAQQVCSDNGSLVTALKAGSDTNYLDTLTQASAYSLYQQRAAVGLSETSLRTGKLSAGDALREFRGIADNAASAANSGLKAAAKDLCHTKGSIENYDFCTELLPSSQGPFSLECLQSAFQKAGGQKTGTMFPTQSNLGEWFAYNSWADVLYAIDQMAANAKSTDRRIQEEAITEFYGLELDDKTVPVLPNINNVEIFWFTPDANLANAPMAGVFLGRRIRSQIPTIMGNNGLPGSISAAGSFVFFTNMHIQAGTSVNIKVTSDSAFILHKDKPLSSIYSGNGTITDNEISAYRKLVSISSPIDNSSNAWKLNGTNVLTGYYCGGGKTFKVEYKPLTGPFVPAECGCYGKPTADNSLRVYTPDECQNGLNGNWYSGGECIRRSGGSYTYDCRGLNASAKCTNVYSLIPPKSLFLLQDPYAPMITFDVLQNFANYNCDYPFCDKRLGSHKMKFQVYGAAGATPNFIGTSRDKKRFTLNKSFMAFKAGAGMMATFLLKIYSFMTLTLMIRFTSLPSNRTHVPFFILWPSYPNIDYPAMYLTGIGANTARLDMGSTHLPYGGTNAYGTTSPPMMSDGPIIGLNKTYLITLRAIRTVEGDVNSLKSLQVGAGLISDLQKNPSRLKEATPLVWANSMHLDNPNTGTALFPLFLTNNIIRPGEGGSCEYDLFSMQLYDYYLSGENLKHAAYNDWAKPAANIYT